MPTIQELIAQVRTGEIVLPEFQRGYVWNRNQVRKFVSALYRRHPTGHLLIWKTVKPSGIRGGMASTEGHTQLLLDGQQRLTSLFVLMEGKPPPFYEGEHLFFDLYFNVQTEEFRFWQKSLMDGNPQWVSVHDFLKEGLNALLERLDNMDEVQKHLVQANLLRFNRLDSIRNYQYQADVLSGDDLAVDEVVAIFNEVNSEGTRLTKADLALAHVCTLWPEARRELRHLSSAMGEHGFGVDLNFLIRSLAAVASASVLLEGSFYNVTAEDLQLGWKKVSSSFEHLVNVLRHDAYVDSLRDLPTPYVLLPMTVFLARNGSTFTSSVQKAKFIRWMFLASIWGRYSASTESTLQKDISVLDEPDPTAALEGAILQERGRLVLEASDIAGKGAGSAADKLSYIVARARDAKDWFSGVTLYKKAIGKSNGLEAHHIFPKAVLYKSGYDSNKDRRIVNEVANRAFLTQRANRKILASRPTEYLPGVQALHPGALQAQSVPMNQKLWQVENYREFLAERAKLLAASMNEYLDSLVPADAAPELGSQLTELIAEGESTTLEFKSSLRWGVPEGGVNKALEKVIVKTIAGFLNGKEGGTLLIGVADDGSILGLDGDYGSSPSIADRDGFELHVRKLLSNAMGESIHAFVTVTFHGVNGQDVCQVRIDPSDHPIYVQDEGKSVFFLRTGNATNALPVHEVVKYYATRWG
jgi:hypothetical protein